MPQPKPPKVKKEKVVMAPTSIKRPMELVDKVDTAMRKLAVDLKWDANHSQLVCILEVLWLENPSIQSLVKFKITQAKP